MSLIHHPVYLPFEKNLVCSDCLLYYRCKTCIKICRRQINDTTQFVYFQYDCDCCSRSIKVLLCGICKNLGCKGRCK